MMYRVTLFVCLIMVGYTSLQAQIITLTGRVVHAQTGEGLADAVVAAGDMAVGTAFDGSFAMRLNPEIDRKVTIGMDGFLPVTVTIPPDAPDPYPLGEIKLAVETERTKTEDLIQEIPVIELTASDFDENAAGNVFSYIGDFMAVKFIKCSY